MGAVAKAGSLRATRTPKDSTSAWARSASESASRGRASLAGERALFRAAPVRPNVCVTIARVGAGRRQSRRTAQEAFSTSGYAI